MRYIIILIRVKRLSNSCGPRKVTVTVAVGQDEVLDKLLYYGVHAKVYQIWRSQEPLQSTVINFKSTRRGKSFQPPTSFRTIELSKTLSNDVQVPSVANYYFEKKKRAHETIDRSWIFKNINYVYRNYLKKKKNPKRLKLECFHKNGDRREICPNFFQGVGIIIRRPI